MHRLEIQADHEGVDLVVFYDAGATHPWIGIASFPLGMEDVADVWADRLTSENDLEDLFREWAPQETWWGFQRIRSALGV